MFPTFKTTLSLSLANLSVYPLKNIPSTALCAIFSSKVKNTQHLKSAYYVTASTILSVFNIYLFHLVIWLCLVSAVHVGSSSSTRDRTQAACTGTTVLASGPPGKSLF